ncbi:MAG TPA: LamG domain-containing protein [Planctomycetaceae bacterium]|nr:LamG domain-containing protein [Planctomycetaceae bacterium]HIQ22450.1 LamG domain-containing protein [Planctomycetota bacterium]
MAKIIDQMGDSGAMMRNLWNPARGILNAILLLAVTSSLGAGKEFMAHFPLDGNAQDVSGNGNHGVVHGVRFVKDTIRGKTRVVGVFDGLDDWIEVPHRDVLRFGKADFSISVWLHTESPLDDIVGDLVSKYDAAARRGFVFNVKHNVGVPTSPANDRHLQFGVDDGSPNLKWTDCGRPGKAVLVYTLTVHGGHLYAGTCVAGKDDAGRVFRYAGGTRWIDCGAPDRCNAVSALASYQGQLYAAVSKYRLRGSALAESENPHRGGRVYRYDGARKWVLVGTLPNVEAINGLVVFRGKLHASSMYAPAGLFRYEGGNTWNACGSPEGKRVEALCVYNGHLFATGYDEGAVYRYDGRRWTHCGRLGDNTQTYSFAVYEGGLYVGTWRSGRAYRYDGDHRWIDVGRLGNELELMGMSVYNGKLYGGTLPLAEVYRFDGPHSWRKVGRVDHTPNVRYRRAWSMAVFQGKLFVGTLPSGHVWSLESGKSVTHDRSLPAGWIHVAAVRSSDRLRLYVNGRTVATSSVFNSASYDLTNAQPLRIGFGSHDFFHGRMSDLRIYRGALNAGDIEELMRHR